MFLCKVCNQENFYQAAVCVNHYEKVLNGLIYLQDNSYYDLNSYQKIYPRFEQDKFLYHTLNINWYIVIT